MLASGDPFFYGIGSLLMRDVSRDEMLCLPAPSAFSLAAARLGWGLQDCALLSLHGRALDSIIAHLQPGARILALSWDGETPAQLARLLVARGMGGSTLTVCENMGGAGEKIRRFQAQGFDAGDIVPLNTIGLEVKADAGARIIPQVPGRPDSWFEHDGQITKREVRAITLAALAPQRGETLWDIGAGSGAIGIEWLLCNAANRAIAVEQHPGRAARIARNALAFGVPHLRIVEGAAPQALHNLPQPDAIFIGGGATSPGLLDMALAALRCGGRLVVNAVTIETQAELARRFAQIGGDMVTINIARADKVGGFHGWRPAMPVVQWCVVKP